MILLVDNTHASIIADIQNVVNGHVV